MDGAKVNHYAALVMGWFLISRVWVFGKCHREMGLKGKFYRGQRGMGPKKGSSKILIILPIIIFFDISFVFSAFFGILIDIRISHGRSVCGIGVFIALFIRNN